MLSMGRPLNELFDRPKPKISWNLSRGKARRGPQTLVRPVRFGQLLRALAPGQPGGHDAGQRHDRDRHHDASGREELAHPGLGHDQAQAGDQDAGHHADQGGPRMREDQDGYRRNDDEQGDPAAHLAAEPEHDHQPERNRRVVRDLRGRDCPEHAGEPSPRHGMAGRHQQAQQHRA